LEEDQKHAGGMFLPEEATAHIHPDSRIIIRRRKFTHIGM
jgi:hypothetical protein